MGLFSGSNLGRAGLGWATGGLSEVYGALNKKPKGPGAYQMQPLADPSNIKADPKLADMIGGIGTTQQNNLSNVFNKARSTVANDSAVRGTSPSPYIEGRLGQSQDMAGRNLRGGLEGILGDTAYKNFQGERGYLQDERTAREIGALNKPTTLEEILGGLSGAAGAGGTLYGALGGRSRTQTSSPSSYPLTYGGYSDIQPGLMSFQDPYLEAYYNGR